MTSNLFPKIAEGPLWAFCSNTKMTLSQVDIVAQSMKQFLMSWTAHGASVRADFEILDQTVIVIAADQAASDVTGCSKDKLHHLLLNLGSELGIDFFDRMQIPLINENTVSLVHWNSIEDQLAAGELDGADEFIDLTINQLSTFRNSGQKSLSSLFITT